MKKKVLIGIALLLVVGLVAGCGKTTTVTTTATVTTMATTTKPVTTTATATTTVTAVQTTTATVRTTTTATVTTTETVTLSAGGVAPPKLSFTAKTYSDTTNKFSFSYASSWGVGTGFVASDTSLAWFSDQAYNCPAVLIDKLPDTIASLSDVFTKNLNLTNAAVTDGSITTAQNGYGITADVLEGSYNSDATTVLNVRIYGFKSGGFWWIMFFYQHPSLGDLKGGGSNPVWANEVFSTWQFTK